MRSLPIRLRLATWYFVVFATVQLAFGAAMWVALRHNLYAIVDENLDERVESVRRFIDSQRKNADLAKMREELTETYDIEPEGREEPRPRPVRSSRHPCQNPGRGSK